MQSQKETLPTCLIFQGRSSAGHSSNTPILSLADPIKGGAKWNELTFHSSVTKIHFHQFQQQHWRRGVTELSEQSWWVQASLTPQLSALLRPCSCFFRYPDIMHHTGDTEYLSSEWIPSPSETRLWGRPANSHPEVQQLWKHSHQSCIFHLPSFYSFPQHPLF